MYSRLFSLLITGLLLGGASAENPPAVHIVVPTPAGLQRCAADDPLNTAETRIAEKLGGEYLGCFQSAERLVLPGDAPNVSAPAKIALAIALRDQNYKLADLGGMLATVRQQWKDFEPLGKALKDSYIAQLNTIISNNGSPSGDKLVSVKPTLVAIDQDQDDFYTVTSIRTYAVEVKGQQVTYAKVNADAVALQGARIIRLTIQRAMTDSADVEQARHDIADWARATTARRPSD